MQKGLIEFYCGEARAILKSLPENSIHCAITSPPYYGLRDYGLEPTIWEASSGCSHEWGEVTGYVGHRGNRGQVPQTKWRANETYPQHVACQHEWGMEAGRHRSSAHPDQSGGVGNRHHGTRGEQGYAAAAKMDASAGSFCIRCGTWRGCLGLEPEVGLYVEHLVEVCREVWRVLRPDGIFWLNVGDSYASTNVVGNREGTGKSGLNCFREGYIPPVHRKDVCVKGAKRSLGGLRSKSLCLVPQRLAIALADDGWIVRNWITWTKGNKLPESVRDRFTVDSEPILMLTKTERYFFDMHPVREEATGDGAKGSKFNRGKTARHQEDRSSEKEREETPATRQPRTTWLINTQPFPGAHFACFPEKLVERMLLCSTSECGCCALCGAPYRRVVEKGAPLEEWKQACGADSAGGYNGQAQKNYEEAGAQNASATKARILAGMVERRTVGWEATCRCAELPALNIVDAVARLLDPNYQVPVVPCTVLDPFAGSCTTGVVAKRLGRRAILVDMSSAYIEMGRRRCGEEVLNAVPEITEMAPASL